MTWFVLTSSSLNLKSSCNSLFPIILFCLVHINTCRVNILVTACAVCTTVPQTFLAITPPCSTNCPALTFGVLVKLRLEVVPSWAHLVAKLLSWVRLLRNKGSEVFRVGMRIGRKRQTEIIPYITCPSFITRILSFITPAPVVARRIVAASSRLKKTETNKHLRRKRVDLLETSPKEPKSEIRL